MTDEEKLQLEEEFGQIASRVWTSKIVKPDDAVPDLFHYTNSAGLPGILRSRSLWATHFQSLNDPSEMRYGIDQATSRIRALADEGPEEKCRFLRPVGELLDGSTVVVATPYVVSFSDDGKLRSQWEKYGDGGVGFSIAFDLRQSSTLFGEGTSVLNIAYDPTVQPDILSATIEEHWNVLLRWEPLCGQQRFARPSTTEEESLEGHCRTQLIFLLLLTECVAFKNPDPFREEQEWRQLTA